MASQDPQPSTLNPGMVYRPVNTRNMDDGNNDGDDKLIKFPFNLMALTRFLAGVFSLTGVSLMLSWQYMVRPSYIFAVVALFFSLFWNIFVLLWQIYLAFGSDDRRKFKLPKFRVEFGSCHFSCGGTDDSDDVESEGQRLLDGGGAPKTPKLKMGKHVYRLIDLVFGITLLITGLVGEANRYYWRIAPANYVMVLLVATLEFNLVFMSFFKVFGPTICTIRPIDDEKAENYQIRLPENAPTQRGTVSDGKLSVVA